MYHNQLFLSGANDHPLRFSITAMLADAWRYSLAALRSALMCTSFLKCAQAMLALRKPAAAYSLALGALAAAPGVAPDKALCVLGEAALQLNIPQAGHFFMQIMQPPEQSVQVDG